jgi:hypothetical protein
MRGIGFWSVTGSVLVSAHLALAASVLVPPGPGTPVQDAIDAASPGDTIRLTVGTYGDESLVVTKPLKLRGVRSTSTEPGQTTLFLSTCPAGSPPPMLTIQADGVTVRGIAFAGAPGGGVEVVGRDHVRLQDVFVGSNCPAVAGTAFDVEGSTRVTLSKVWAAGSLASHGPVGIRIAGTPANGRVRVRASIAGQYDVGVLLEHDGAAAVQLGTSYVNYNGRGILLRDTVGALVSRNREVLFNTTSGIEAEADATGNKIVGNRIEGSAADVLDAGSGNCWKNNSFTTGTDPGCP